jgi:UDPglucose 6-dehydrogenase
MRVSIIGSGVVGEATGKGLHMKGNAVLFHDIDGEKLNALEQQGFHVTGSLAEAIHGSDILFICVPTPTVRGTFDAHVVEGVVADIGHVLSSAEGYKRVVVRSTVLPTVTRARIVPLLEECSHLHAGLDFGVCMNPEFLRERLALHDFLNPSRVVIGEFDQRSGDAVAELYAPFNAPVIRTNLDTAEIIKYAANLFLATKISFFNEIYMLCEKMRVNADTVSKTVALDPRIGDYGIQGGKPFDGNCFPKDLAAFITFAKSLNVDPKLLQAALAVNEAIDSTPGAA